MIPLPIIRRSGLALSVFGALLVSLASNPARAGCEYLAAEHPLRGDFPCASESSPAPDQMAEGTHGWREMMQHPLRGEFPRASDTSRAPLRVATRTHGLQEMMQHPLRGEFPRASDTARALAAVQMTLRR